MLFRSKLYAIIDETRLPPGESTVICTDFLSSLLPTFDAAVFDGDSAPVSREAPEARETPAADAGNP